MAEVVVHKERTPFFEEVGKALEAIRDKAFELFDRRGRDPGFELEDWLAAERELFNVPKAEMTEDEHVFTMAVDVAGFEDADVHVTAEPDQIVIAAEMEKTADGFRETQSMFRRFVVTAIDPAKVTARVEGKMLTIVAPKVVAVVNKVPVAIDRPMARAVEESAEKKNGETPAARAVAA